MRYDLTSPILNRTFYIECTLANKPDTLGELVNGISSGRIHWQLDYEKQMIKLYAKVMKDDLLDMNDPLTPDYRTQKPIRHNINWIPTENLK